jgi:hypothetical protein
VSAEKRVKTIEREDGKARVCIMVRDDGLYRFYWEFEDEDPPYGSFWTAQDFSGLYGTLEEAEREARLTVPWLRSQL